jgi:hypothetical protein
VNLPVELLPDWISIMAEVVLNRRYQSRTFEMLSSIGDLSLILYANGGKDHCSDHDFGRDLLAISFIKVVKISPTVGSVVFFTKFYKKNKSIWDHSRSTFFKFNGFGQDLFLNS